MPTRIKELKQYLNQIYFIRWNHNIAKIFGIILFIFGIILLVNPLGSDNKLSVLLIFFGIYIFLFFPEKNMDNNIELYIFLFLTGWLVIMTFLTVDKNLDIFFISVVFGMLMVKEFANGYLSPPLKKKLSILTLVFFSLCMVLVAERIINFFSM